MRDREDREEEERRMIPRKAKTVGYHAVRNMCFAHEREEKKVL